MILHLGKLMIYECVEDVSHHGDESSRMVAGTGEICLWILERPSWEIFGMLGLIYLTWVSLLSALTNSVFSSSLFLSVGLYTRVPR